MEVKNLVKNFEVKSKSFFSKKYKYIHAVDDVSFELAQGVTFSLVGESGSGKSTTGRLILRLIEPDSGNIIFNGKDITKLHGEDLRKIRRNIQIIFQDPLGSLNPRIKIRKILQEPIIIHKLYSTKEGIIEKVAELIKIVGLDQDILDRYPHELSGGQRQRICIARALSLSPQLIVADEPLSALDVSIQAQIINLLKQLQKDFGISYVFISHDLRVVRFLSHNVGVMYLGEIVEKGDTDNIFSNPLHPYTEALLSAIPKIDSVKNNKKIVLKGEPPSNIELPYGCRFHPRCHKVMKICHEEKPELIEVKPNRWVSCHLY